MLEAFAYSIVDVYALCHGSLHVSDLSGFGRSFGGLRTRRKRGRFRLIITFQLDSIVETYQRRNQLYRDLSKSRRSVDSDYFGSPRAGDVPLVCKASTGSICISYESVRNWRSRVQGRLGIMYQTRGVVSRFEATYDSVWCCRPRNILELRREPERAFNRRSEEIQWSGKGSEWVFGPKAICSTTYFQGFLKRQREGSLQREAISEPLSRWSLRWMR